MSITLFKSGKTKPAPTTSTPSTQVQFQTSRSRDYTTGHPDGVVEAIAAEAGNAGIYNPDVSGENTDPDALDLLTRGHDAAAEVIGHGGRDEAQSVIDVIEANEPLVKTAERAALSAVDKAGSAEKKQIALRHRILSAGLPLPTRKAFWIFFGSIVLLFAGDWSLNATGFEGFGLSDHPWIPGVGFSDDLHLASLTAVAGLVFLADGAGHKLRQIAHDIYLRRQIPKAQRKDALWPSAFDVAVVVVCIGGAFYALQGLSVIRANYLRSQGAPANASAFLAIQFGVLIAAIYLSYWHANPLAKQWNSQVIETTKAKATETVRVIQHDRIVSIFNADIDRLDTVFALAGHHVRADSANVAAQHARYRHRYILAQSEPAQSKLFKDGIEQPAEYTDSELYQKLVGVTPVPTFAKATTDNVIDRKAQIQDEIRELLARIDETEISKLNLVEKSTEPEITSDNDAKSKIGALTPAESAGVLAVSASKAPDGLDAEVGEDEAAA